MGNHTADFYVGTLWVIFGEILDSVYKVAEGLEGRSENFASQRRFIEFYGDNEKMTPNSSSDALATK